MEILAIIPARGGSKEIPKKNLSLLAGEPLISYTIKQALETKSINRVVVSTDDFEIGKVSQEAGAEVVLRPKDISHDTATSEDALMHVLDYLYEKEGYEPDLIVFLQATSPLRKGNDIQNAIDTLIREEADSLFSAYLIHDFIWRVDKNKSVEPLNYDYSNRLRRQECPEDLAENGSIYVFKTGVIRKNNNRLGGKIAIYRMDKLNSFQIDNKEDLELVRQITGGICNNKDLSILKNICLLVLDFDGVMTDNRVLVGQNGKESVICHRGDGWGITQLKKHGVKVIVISTETNPVVSARCQKLDIECVQGCEDKKKALDEIIKKKSFKINQVAFVGNDNNDRQVMEYAGVAIAVSDSVSEIIKVADFVTTQKGGFGAVREVADWILTVQGKDD